MKPSARSFVRSPLFLGIILMATASSFSFAQLHTINGRIIFGGSREPVTNVALTISGKYVGYSAQDGSFRIHARAGDTLCFRHIAAEDAYLLIPFSLQDTLLVSLVEKTYPLRTATVMAPKPSALTDGSRFYVLDYELYAEGLLLLGFRKGAQTRKEMILLGKEGDTLASCTAAGVNALLPDCKGGVWAVRNDSAFVVVLENTSLILWSGEKAEDFSLWYPYLADCFEDAYFFQIHEMQGQQLNNYVFFDGSDTLRRFRVIEDRDALKRSMMGAYFDGNEADLRFQAEIMNKPLFAPLFVSGDSVLIFNFDEKICEVYDVNGQDRNAIPLEKPSGAWKLKSVVRDPVEGKFYSVQLRNGIVSLFEMPGNNLTATIPGLLFPEKIRIHQNICYFLCKPEKGSEVRHLYSFSLR